MRQKAGALNRMWLIIIGVILLAGGVLWLLLATGIAAAVFGMAASNDTVVAPRLAHAFHSPVVAVALAVIGIILVLAGLAWIIVQIPRRNVAKPYRLHHDPEAGISSCSPDVLSRAVDTQVEKLPGVSKATSIVRGASTSPELILRLTTTERADIQNLISRIRGEVIHDFTSALESRLDWLGVQIDISSTSRPNTTSVTL